MSWLNNQAPLFQRHAGKTVCFRIERLPEITIRIEATGFRLAPKQMANVTFTGPMNAFIASLFGPRQAGRLQIEGDMGLAEDLMAYMEGPMFNWREAIEQIMGSTWSYPIIRFLENAQKTHQTFWQARQADWAYFLQDEVQLIPQLKELEQFYRDVDLLRHDCARIEARLHRLESHLKG